jgi:ribA/ribD-fused uncharacterized protein
MNNCSFFIKDKALFGSSPSQESVEELEENGVKYFIDLTTQEEKEQNKVIVYTTKHTYINYPINDRHIPTNWQSYASFIIKISRIIKSLRNNDKLYINCRAGLGRSGVVVASILCYLFNLTPEESLQYTTKCLGNRKKLKEKWRKIGSPQTYTQKKFIHKFFYPLNFYRTYKHSSTFGFSNYSTHIINIDGIGIFPNAEAAFQTYKNLDDKEYIQKQLECKSVIMSKYLGSKIKIREDWEEKKVEIMEKILELKFEQHDDIRENLITTGLRPIVEHTKDDDFWGDGGDGSGKNMLGKILMKIRNKYYEKLFPL